MAGDDKHQHKFYCTDRVWDVFLQWLSHKYPIFIHGMISTEIEAAIVERMTREKVSTAASTHTQYRKEKQELTNHTVKEVKVEPKMVTITAAATNHSTNSSTSIVLSNDGNRKDSKQPFPSILTDWLPKIRVDLSDIQSIIDQASPQLIKDTRESLDPNINNGYRKGLLNGLQAKRFQRGDIDWKIEMEEREKELEPEIIKIAKHLENNNLVVDGNKASMENIYKAIRFATKLKDMRSLKPKFVEYEEHEYYSKVSNANTKATVIYKLEEKLTKFFNEWKDL